MTHNAEEPSEIPFDPFEFEDTDAIEMLPEFMEGNPTPVEKVLINIDKLLEKPPVILDDPRGKIKK